MKRIIIVFVLFPVSLLLSQSNSERPFPFTKIAPNLYKIEVDVNSIIASIGPDGVLLCDVGGESKGTSVMATVRDLGGEKIDYIIDTHWHVDHTGGNICFGKDALIIAHENVRKRLSEDKYLKFWDEEHPAFPEYALPDMVFKERMTIHVNGEEIEIIHLPCGHTDGDVVVYFRKSNIIHVGDCLFSNGFPAIDFEMGGSVEGFADNLRRIAFMMPSDVRIIVGHGPDYTIKELLAYERMVRSSLNAVRDAMQNNLSVEAMQQSNLLEEWEEYGSGFFSCDEWINMIYHSLIHKSNTDSKTLKRLPGLYLGQKLPGMTPEIFAPGIITTDSTEGCSGWGNDMEYYIFQRRIDGKSRLYIMNQINGMWSEPKILPFFDKYQVGDFTIAPDGKTMVFASKILIDEIGSEGEGANIWIAEKTATGWTEPKHIGAPVNTKYHDSYPSLAKNGNLYFFSRKPGGFGQSDIYMSEFIDGKYQTPVNLGGNLNTEYHEWDTYIAPDESYMIYCSMMPGGLGGDDLYITFKTNDGSWSKPVHLGNEINTEKSENRPYISPDGKYFFYTSSIRGNRDIYWVDAKIIEELKPQN